MNVVEFTVAIPTFNGATRLPEVLERLRSQTGLQSVSLEVIVVDNNSTDDTAEVVRRYQRSFPYPLRYCFESRQGAAHARNHAVQQARSDLIGFLDDDNLPADTWVAAAVAFAQAHPQAGAIASRIEADYEVEPPPNFHRIAPFLAITQRGAVPLLYEAHKRLLPPSAGLVVRQRVWQQVVPLQPVLCGRMGGNMLTGEDLEALSYIRQAGWEIWYNPQMELVHKIPHWRLEREYLLRLFRGIGLSRYVTRSLSVKEWQRPWLVVPAMMYDLVKIVRYLWIHKGEVHTDLVAACELELLLSSFVSPLYFIRHSYPHKPTATTREQMAD